MASRIEITTSSTDLPVETQPGRSGAYEENPVTVGSTTTTNLAVAVSSLGHGRRAFREAPRRALEERTSSSPPGITTIPCFVGCRKWWCLPRIRVSRQPSCANMSTISRQVIHEPRQSGALEHHQAVARGARIPCEDLTHSEGKIIPHAGLTLALASHLPPY